MPYQTLLYDTHAPLATITLNRAERLNTIVPPMPDELESAVREATTDAAVKVIVLRGAGRAFCAGFDFAEGFHHWDQAITSDGAVAVPCDVATRNRPSAWVTSTMAAEVHSSTWPFAHSSSSIATICFADPSQNNWPSVFS